MSRCSLCRGEVCQLKYVKIEGRIYRRHQGNLFDDDDEYGWTGVKCHDCGVLFGNTHHVGCDAERCPKCRNQFISCGHLIGVKFHRGLADSKGVKSNVPINQVIAEKLRHNPGKIKIRYDHWLKDSISSYLKYADRYKRKSAKTNSEYRHCLIVLRNILDRMTDEEGEVSLSNEQVFSIWWLMEGHVHTRVQPRKAAKYLKIIDKNWSPG